MPARERRIDRARRDTELTLARVGREIRQARLDHDLSQAATAGAAGVSPSAVGRLERGVAKRVPLEVVARIAMAVGLTLHLRAYPRGEAVRDAAHLALSERLHARLPAAVRWRTEVPFPHPGDLRAWDAMIHVLDARIGIEAETRGRDAQALQRRLALKRRDGSVDHVILLLAHTKHNRAFLRVAGGSLATDFPVPGPVALARLTAGRDPGGSAIILL